MTQEQKKGELQDNLEGILADNLQDSIAQNTAVQEQQPFYKQFLQDTKTYLVGTSDETRRLNPWMKGTYFALGAVAYAGVIAGTGGVAGAVGLYFMADFCFRVGSMFSDVTFRKHRKDMGFKEGKGLAMEGLIGMIRHGVKLKREEEERKAGITAWESYRTEIEPLYSEIRGIYENELEGERDVYRIMGLAESMSKAHSRHFGKSLEEVEDVLVKAKLWLAERDDGAASPAKELSRQPRGDSRGYDVAS